MFSPLSFSFCLFHTQESGLRLRRLCFCHVCFFKSPSSNNYTHVSALICIFKHNSVFGQRTRLPKWWLLGVSRITHVCSVLNVLYTIWTSRVYITRQKYDRRSPGCRRAIMTNAIKMKKNKRLFKLNNIVCYANRDIRITCVLKKNISLLDKRTRSVCQKQKYLRYRILYLRSYSTCKHIGKR